MLLVLATAVVPVGLAATSQSAAGSAGPHASAKPQKVPPVEIPVDPRLFGVHDAHQYSLFRVGTGSIRLWDTGVTWPDIFSSADTPNWSRLDDLVSHAHANGTQVVPPWG